MRGGYPPLFFLPQRAAHDPGGAILEHIHPHEKIFEILLKKHLTNTPKCVIIVIVQKREEIIK